MDYQSISLAVTAISVVAAIIFGVLAVRSRANGENKADTAERTTVIVKLESIGNGITEIKSEMKNVKEDIKENRERIIKVEESAKQAHKRLDTIAGARNQEV